MAEEGVDLPLRRGRAAGESALEQAFEPVGDLGDLGEAEGRARPGEGVGQAVEGAQRLARPAGIAGGVAGRFDLGDAGGEPAGEVPLQSSARRPSGPQAACRERQIAWTVAARAMGSNGLAITSTAPISR